MEVTPIINQSELPVYILQNLPFGILAEDAGRKILMVNKEFKRMFNISLSDSDLKGLPCQTIINTIGSLFSNKEQFADYILAGVEGKNLQNSAVFELNNGRFLSISCHPFTENKADKGHFWHFRDVSEKVEISIELQKQKEFYENILNSIPADIAVFNHEQYIFLNSFAVSKEQITELVLTNNSDSVKAFKQPSHALSAMRHNYFKQAVSKKEDLEWEEEYDRPNGEVRTLLRKFHPHYNSNGLNFIVSYGIDITHIKDQAKKIREEEYRSKSLLNQLKEIVLTVDIKGVIQSINPAWEKVTGYPVLDCIGVKFTDFLCDEASKAEFIDNLEKKGSVPLIERPFCIKNIYGELRWLEGYSSTLKDGNGNFIGSCCTFSDITARKKADEELLSLVKKERELNELKSQFVNMVSHEIRTPLAGILSSVELLEIIHQHDSSALKPRSFKHFSSIKEQVIRLGTLMDNVLLLGKIEAGKMQLNLQEVDLVEACNSIIEADFNNKDLKVLFTVSGKPFKARLDWNLIKHVLTNLISNAIKYSEGKQSPEFYLIFRQEEIKLKVKDYGIGIPKSELNKIFTPFSRASNVGSIDGTGLGLMLSMHFVNMHKGSIDIISEEGNGTTFTVHLPVS